MKKIKLFSLSALTLTLLITGTEISYNDNHLSIKNNEAKAATSNTEFVEYVTPNWAKLSRYEVGNTIFKADRSKFSKLAKYRTYEYNWIGWKVTTATFYRVIYK